VAINLNLKSLKVEERPLKQNSFELTFDKCSRPATSTSTTVCFILCIEHTDAWMSSNQLKMNTNKTQLLWLGTKQQLDKLSVNELQLLQSTVSFSGSISNLGITINSQLSTSGHATSLCQAGFSNCANSSSSSLTTKTIKMLVHQLPRLV